MAHSRLLTVVVLVGMLSAAACEAELTLGDAGGERVDGAGLDVDAADGGGDVFDTGGSPDGTADGGGQDTWTTDTRTGDTQAPPQDTGDDLPDVPADQDLDGDNLPDAWELAAGDLLRLDPGSADSDGDGTADGDEDPDGDGLTNRQEWRAGQADRLTSGPPPHPFRLDLLVELDRMAGTTMPAQSLDIAVRAYAALPLDGVAGQRGVGFHVFEDEVEVARQSFDAGFDARHAFLRAHGSVNLGGLPASQMVHVVLATRRSDLPERGGEVVTHGSGDIAATGVFIYYDALAALHPQCGIAAPPEVAPITLEEALGGTLTHELGHALQLGHEGDVGGGTNFFNVMAVPTSCSTARQRFHGEGNGDPSLGATEATAESRFSDQAAALVRLRNRLSVDAAELEDGGDGWEM